MSTEILLFAVLAFLAAGFLFDTWLSVLNFRHSQSQAWNKEIFTKDQHDKSLRYQREKFIIKTFSSGTSFLLVFSAIGLGLFGLLDNFLRTFTTHPILLVLLFFAVYGLITTLVSFIFESYTTFSIEKRYGFNRTTIGTFLLDTFKSILISAILGGGILSLLVWLNQLLQESFWIAAWAVIMTVILFLFAFQTSVLLPIFNKLNPLPEGDLRNALLNYCTSQGYSIKRLFVMDGSKRSSKANAFFSGIGNSRTVVLFDTLIEKLSIDEVTAVLAHEIGHDKRKHTLASLGLTAGQMFIFTFLFGQILERDEFAMVLGAQPSFHIAAIAFLVLFRPASLLLSWASNTISRKNEFAADKFATSTYKAGSMKSALEKMASEELVNLSPHPWYVKVHYSHPPIVERVKALFN
jgi:STE24 endopeptidase